MNQYGYFDEKSYVITDRTTPRHWYNYLYNDQYVTFVSQVGFGKGFAQDDMGRRLSPVTDRNVYLCDESTFWQATGLPVHEEVDGYSCSHHIGYTDIQLTRNGIQSRCRFFVPNTGTYEVLCVTVTNITDKEKNSKDYPFFRYLY